MATVDFPPLHLFMLQLNRVEVQALLKDLSGSEESENSKLMLDQLLQVMFAWVGPGFVEAGRFAGA